MKISVINGVNLTKLGIGRPAEIYGNENLDEIAAGLTSCFPQIKFDFKNTTDEFELAEFIGQSLDSKDALGYEIKHTDGIIINAGAFSHHSVLVKDAVAGIKGKIPIVEVHIINIFARDVFRRNSVIAPMADGVIAGFDRFGYILAANAIIDLLNRKKIEEKLARELKASQED